jgi:hypothetical protein
MRTVHLARRLIFLIRAFGFEEEMGFGTPSGGRTASLVSHGQLRAKSIKPPTPREEVLYDAADAPRGSRSG